MALANSSTARAFLPEDFGQLLIATASKQSIALQTTSVVTTDAETFRIPLISAEVASGWYAENAQITASDPGLGEEVVVPRKTAGLTQVSNELASDSNPSVTETIGASIARQIATGIDAAFFGTADGNGNVPRGLGNIADAKLTTVDAGAAWASIDPFISAQYAVEAQGGNITAFVANPADAEILAKLKKETDSLEPLLAADANSATRRQITGIDLFTSASVPVGTIYGYDKSRVFTVVRNNVAVETDSSVFFASYSTAVRGVARIGFGYPHAKAIARIKLSN